MLDASCFTQLKNSGVLVAVDEQSCEDGERWRNKTNSSYNQQYMLYPFLSWCMNVSVVYIHALCWYFESILNPYSQHDVWMHIYACVHVYMLYNTLVLIVDITRNYSFIRFIKQFSDTSVLTITVNLDIFAVYIFFAIFSELKNPRKYVQSEYWIKVSDFGNPLI